MMRAPHVTQVMQIITTYSLWRILQAPEDASNIAKLDTAETLKRNSVKMFALLVTPAAKRATKLLQLGCFALLAGPKARIDIYSPTRVNLIPGSANRPVTVDINSWS